MGRVAVVVNPVALILLWAVLGPFPLVNRAQGCRLGYVHAYGSCHLRCRMGPASGVWFPRV